MIDKNLNLNYKNNSSTLPSKTIIINWLKSLFSDLPLNLKIQDFGNGLIYYRLLNHYFPATIPTNKIILHPKNQYEFANNLKQVQQALVQLNIKIHFDVNKVSKRKFLQNWSLINALYRQLPIEDTTTLPNTINRTGKRAFETAFEQPINKNRPILSQSIVEKSNIMNMGNCFKENNSPRKGKWSVNSHMFQNNQTAVIDRVKQILLKSSNDVQKIKQIKMLLSIPTQQEQVIKIEDDEVVNHIIYNNSISQHHQTENNPKT